MTKDEAAIHHAHHRFHRAMQNYHAKSNPTVAGHHEELADEIEKRCAKCGHPVEEEESTSKYFSGDGTSLNKVFVNCSSPDSELGVSIVEKMFGRS
jgi:hypothetical protein